jgi:CheY-like chemotaxis protein
MNSCHAVLSPLPLPENGLEPQIELEGENKSFATRYPLRILLADHNYISRRALTLMLESLGYKFDSVENGPECLDAAIRMDHDLIFLDLDHLPILDGAECTARIREAKIDTTIFALTAFPPEVARLQSMGAGLNGYLQKPLKPDELKQALRMAYLSAVYTAGK